jgi:hypothetical protein
MDAGQSHSKKLTAVPFSSRYVRSLLQWPSPGDSPEFSTLVGVGTLWCVQIAETAAHLPGVLKCLDHPATHERHLNVSCDDLAADNLQHHRII